MSARDVVTIDAPEPAWSVVDALLRRHFGPGGVRGPVAVAVRIGPEWDAHVDEARRRSVELSYARGHVMRWGP